MNDFEVLVTVLGAVAETVIVLAFIALMAGAFDGSVVNLKAVPVWKRKPPKLVSPLGEKHIGHPLRLWSVSEADAQRWATEEMRDWWKIHGRLTWGQWQREQAACRREAQEAGRGAVVTQDWEIPAEWAAEATEASDEQHGNPPATPVPPVLLIAGRAWSPWPPERVRDSRDAETSEAVAAASGEALWSVSGCRPGGTERCTDPT